jgi:hypothetical protein
MSFALERRTFVSQKLLKSWPLYLAALILVVFCEPILTDAYEPNDTFEDAALISLGTITATIEPAEDEDYYRVSIAGEDSLMLIYRLTVPSVLMPEITFYDSSQRRLGWSRAENEGDPLHDSLLVPAGEVILRVRSFNYESSDSSYTLTLSTSLPVVAATD